VESAKTLEDLELEDPLISLAQEAHSNLQRKIKRMRKLLPSRKNLKVCKS